jgi:competence protein ComEC
LRVYFLSVGDGEAIYIRTPQSQDILVDGGSSGVILSKLGERMPFYDNELDFVILTHPHADHVTGLIDVLKKYKVKQVYLTGAVHTTYEYLEFLQILQSRREIKKIKVNNVFEVKLADDLFLKFLYPDTDIKPVQSQNLNNTSVVVKVIKGEKSILLTGDIEQEAEEYLVKTNNLALRSNILKVAHQGSRSSTSLSFLEKVSPETAVVIVNKDNPYGHPHQEVLERLNSLGIEILRTDKDGDVVMQFTQ